MCNKTIADETETVTLLRGCAFELAAKRFGWNRAGAALPHRRCPPTPKTTTQT